MYEGIDHFYFLQSLTHTGSAYQFLDDVPVNLFETAQSLSVTSLVGPPANAEAPGRSPIFCDACGYALENLDEACVWCQFTSDEIPSAQSDFTQDHQNQHDGNFRQVLISLHSGLPDDWYDSQDLQGDLPIAPAMLNFEESSMFPQSSSADLNAGFQHQRLWDQIPPEGGLLAPMPEVGAHQHHGEEDLFENQVALRVWRAVHNLTEKTC